jgi:hypothetical protein
MLAINNACENGGYVDVYVNHLGGDKFDYRDQYSLRKNFSIHNYNQFSLHIHNIDAYRDLNIYRNKDVFEPRFSSNT